MIELVIALVLGILAGSITGLIPGIHINLVASLLLFSFTSSTFSPIIFVIFIVAMSITHTFIDFIPSVFLGAPDEDTFLSILPGHQLFKEGRGHEAVVLTLYGSLVAIPIILLMTPIFIYFLPIIFTAIKTIIPYILIFISFFLIFREEKFLTSIIIFLLAGILGFLTFSLPVKEPLMPLLSGLFGLSGLIISLKDNPLKIKQKISPLKKIKIPKLDFFKTALTASIAAPLCSFLPGIGSGHAAVIGSEISKQDNRRFLVLVGAINTIVMGLSFVTLYAIGKGRTGSAAAVNLLIPTLTFPNLSIILITIIISGILAFILGINLSKFTANSINKINYRYLTIFVIFIIIIFNLIFSNLLGILILLTATALGIFTISSGSRRINMMGCLLIPSIMYYLIF
ncbi:MAG: tripartite tricarboxylate transporter permease [archaeon]|nr:tripartite tricarboxylate transporter permease [archaeon]